MHSLHLSVYWACLLTCFALGYEQQQQQHGGGKFYLLRNVLHRLAEDLPGINYDNMLDELERGHDPYRSSNDLDASSVAWEEEENRQEKRGPPSGFSAVRGKRLPMDASSKRVPSNTEFFGARGKKGDVPDKRLPSNKEFFGVRGKKNSAAAKRFFWGNWNNNREVREGVKRMPQSEMFFGSRGKKSGSDEKKRVLAQHFFGARGKKSAYSPSDFFGESASDGHQEKRLLSDQYFASRGKKSDVDFAKRISNKDFFGVRGKKSSGFLVDSENQDFEKRLSQDQFFGARGKKSAFALDNSISSNGENDLKNDLLRLSNNLRHTMDASVIRQPDDNEDDVDDDGDDDNDDITF